MSQAREGVALLNKVVEALPPEERAAINECTARILAITDSYGEKGKIGIAIASLEYAARLEE